VPGGHGSRDVGDAVSTRPREVGATCPSLLGYTIGDSPGTVHGFGDSRDLKQHRYVHCAFRRRHENPFAKRASRSPGGAAVTWYGPGARRRSDNGVGFRREDVSRKHPVAVTVTPGQPRPVVGHLPSMRDAASNGKTLGRGLTPPQARIQDDGDEELLHQNALLLAVEGRQSPSRKISGLRLAQESPGMNENLRGKRASGCA